MKKLKQQKKEHVKKSFMATLFLLLLTIFLVCWLFYVYKEATYPCEQLQYMNPNLPERCLDSR